MRCSDARRLLLMEEAVGYGTPRRGGLAKHLRGCGFCREEATRLDGETRVFRAALRGLPLDPAFTEKVWARIDGSPGARAQIPMA